MSVRVARSRRLVAEGYALATVARVMQISRQALYRVPTPRAAPQRRPLSDPVEARPGFFRVERPRQLWQIDMTSTWVAEHGWCYLNAIIDCCTREIVAWQLELRCRAEEAIALVERAAAV
ncbi:MAG TPA: DDE-type integrase/transposase/recombinase [Gaiellaceae bacterium]